MQSVPILTQDPVAILEQVDVLNLLHDLGALLPCVVVDGSAVGLVAVAHYHDVVTSAEGVRVDGLGVQDHLGVLPGGLAGGRPVEVPLRPEGEPDQN